MCGITGIFNLNARKKIAQPIRVMTDALAHRGPDSDGFYVEDDVIALGHRRLSIIDLSTGANQPFLDDTGRYVLIFNGEIYNYLDVKAQLLDYPFRTTSDTEVILAAYLRWGTDCLTHLNGMFAFALWDKVEQTLFVARDRLGVKPFYYYCDDAQFVFASEVRAVLASGFVPRRLNREAARNYLVFQSVYAPLTIIDQVFQLMPGEYAVVSPSGMRKQRYWAIEKPTPVAIPDAETARRQVHELLSASVQRRMISDVPLGAFLSGGIDSSAVVALMAEASERPIDTFTVVFDEKQFDESQYANVIAKRFNTHHTTIRLTPNDFLAALPEALNAVDAPSGDGLNTYVVSKATKQAGITVALSGLGGDELFAGYPYFRYYKKLRTAFPPYWSLPAGLRKTSMGLLNGVVRHPKIERFARILSSEEPSIDALYPYFRLVNTEGEANALLNYEQTDKLIIQQLLSARKADIAKLPYSSHVSVAELLGYTLNVLLRDTDQFSMASALEVREPFFDFPLVEYVLQVPDAIKLDRSSPKNLLVSALGDLLPDEIVHRPKMGFSFPWKQWLLNELRQFCEDSLAHLKNCSAFNYAQVQAEWQLFVSSRGEKCSWVKIWQLVVLAHWLKTNGIEC